MIELAPAGLRRIGGAALRDVADALAHERGLAAQVRPGDRSPRRRSAAGASRASAASWSCRRRSGRGSRRPRPRATVEVDALHGLDRAAARLERSAQVVRLDHRPADRRWGGHEPLLRAGSPYAGWAALAPLRNIGHYLHSADICRYRSICQDGSKAAGQPGHQGPPPGQLRGLDLRPERRRAVRPVGVRRRHAGAAGRVRLHHRRPPVRAHGPLHRGDHSRPRPPRAGRLHPPVGRPGRPAPGHRARSCPTRPPDSRP